MVKAKQLPKRAAKWPILQPGDVIDIVAPAWACSRRELSGAIRELKRLGFSPRLDKKIFAPGSMFAQNDAERFRQLRRALLAKDSKAVWCLRGGYGSLRLLPQLAKLKAPPKSKILLGYSDITTLHLFLNAFWGWPSIHGPLLDRLGRGEIPPRDLAEVLGLLAGNQLSVKHLGLKFVGRAGRGKAGASRRLTGKLLGGNLATLQSSLGTPWQVQGRGAIIFFEDWGERPHRVDRMLQQLEQAGFFEGAKAVIFGPLLVGQSKDQRRMWKEVIPDFASRQKFPVLKGLQSGHGPRQRPLPCLGQAQLVLRGGSADLEVFSPQRTSSRRKSR